MSADRRVDSNVGGPIQDRLTRLGLTLPPAPRPVGNYLLGRRSGDLVFVSGQASLEPGGSGIRGRLGEDLTLEEGQQAARLAVLNCLAELSSVVGSLDRVSAIVKVNGYVRSAQGFVDQPKVMNGASDLLEAVFGEAGKHARTSVGVSELPGGAAVEIELVAQVKATTGWT